MDEKLAQTSIEAAEWLLRLDEDSSAACRSEFAAWLRHAPAHMEEFLSLSATARAVQGIDPQREIDVEALLREPPANIVAFQGAQHISAEAGSTPIRRTFSRRWLPSAAAAMAALSVIPFLSSHLSRGERFETGVGEQRSVQMEDGSLLHLNTQSRVEVEYSKHARNIRLLEGEALFVVAQEPTRPFRVTARNSVIQAVGTEFNVYLRQNETKVSVVEGRVKVAPIAPGSSGSSLPPLLAAGEEAKVLDDGRILTSSADNVAKAVAWRERRLVFKSERLDMIAAEFNRYNRTPIQVEGAAAEKRMTGTFNANDPGAFIRFLKDDSTLELQLSPDESVVRLRE